MSECTMHVSVQDTSTPASGSAQKRTWQIAGGLSWALNDKLRGFDFNEERNARNEGADSLESG